MALRKFVVRGGLFVNFQNAGRPFLILRLSMLAGIPCHTELASIRKILFQCIIALLACSSLCSVLVANWLPLGGASSMVLLFLGPSSFVVWREQYPSNGIPDSLSLRERMSLKDRLFPILLKIEFSLQILPGMQSTIERHFFCFFGWGTAGVGMDVVKRAGIVAPSQSYKHTWAFLKIPSTGRVALFLGVRGRTR